MKKILEVTYLGRHPLNVDGVNKTPEDKFQPGETRELIEDSEIRAFIGAGNMTNDDGSPAFKVKEKKVTKAEEEKKLDKAEKKSEKEAEKLLEGGPK